jgi:N-acetylmuramoyl-L-alanine amidase
MKKVYLSPSNQLNNAYAGLKVTEGQEMPLVANVVASELKRNGVTAYLPTHEFLADRINEANTLAVDVYVALHTNAGGGQGTEGFYNPNKIGSQKLAQCVYDAVAILTPTKDRGLKNGMLQFDGQGFAEIRDPHMACTLIELEFHDNAPGAKWIIDHINALGVAVAQGILKYLGIVWKPIVTPKPPVIKYVKPTGTLKNGSSGVQVTLLQKILNVKYGYKLVADGKFGNLTEVAVRDFQKRNKLMPDGVVGSLTIAKL